MWKEKDQALVAHFEFKDFVSAFGFMSEVALLAERLNHHPTWTNTYNRLDIRLSTHDAGDVVTDKDRVLASEIESLWKSRQA